MTKPKGAAVRIKQFCSAPENPVSITEMKEFMAACWADDAKHGAEPGTTMKELADGIPT